MVLRSQVAEWDERCEWRNREPVKDQKRLQPNTKFLEPVADELGLTRAKPRPIPGVSTHRAKMHATPVLTGPERIDLVLAHLCIMLDRADAQSEVVLGCFDNKSQGKSQDICWRRKMHASN